MNRQTWTDEDDYKQLESKTSIYLLLAASVSVFSVMLIIVTCLLSWETWMIPLIAAAIVAVWAFHIVKSVSGKSYEYLCGGIMLMEFFFYGVHETSLFDMAIIVCLMLLVFSILNKKIFLRLTIVTYFLILFYHCFFLRTIRLDMPILSFARLGLGVVATICALRLAGYLLDRRAQEEKHILILQHQLEAARQRNADFLSNISHELRTPINMVTGISEVALGRKLSMENRDDLQSIQLAGKRLASQINDILDYTEIVGKTLVAVEDHYMVPSVVGDVISMIAVQHKGTNLEMIFDLDVNIPYVLKGDGDKLCRVLKILLDNAIKFTEEGGIYVRITSRQEEYGINLNIDICDTGIGINSSQLAHICDDFYQADSNRIRSVGGLGLGLPIARGLLHAMGGFLYVESKEGQGTQAHVSIPQAVVDDRPSMTVKNPEKFCVAAFFKADKYSRKEVRGYYDNMILHMAVGLGVEGHRVYHIEELEKLRAARKLTHLVIAKEEYEEDIAYFEELGKTICIILIVADACQLPANSSLVILHKPFSPLPVVNILNGETHGKEIHGGAEEEKSFICEGVSALVVDDEEMNLVVAMGILSRYGMQVDTCLSGERAVELCMEEEYDVIFLDHMMPGIDGVETLKRIRNIKSGFYLDHPIIALTANAISGAREMFKSEGFTEFVPKPIERPVLERALRKVLPPHLIHYETELEDSLQKMLEELREYNESEHNQFETERAEEFESAKIMSDLVEDQIAKQELDPFEQLRSANFDVEMGLTYCGDSQDFYEEMLRMFVSQSKEKREEIILLYNEKNWADYAIKVHALKSASKTIGAAQLSEQARLLEQAGKSGDAVYIEENHAKMIDLYDWTCNLIAEIFGVEDQREGGDAQ